MRKHIFTVFLMLLLSKVIAVTNVEVDEGEDDDDGENFSEDQDEDLEHRRADDKRHLIFMQVSLTRYT